MKVQVREVSSKGVSSLIEWSDDDGNFSRSVVPLSQLIYEDGLVFVNNPDNGAPYGEDWESLVRAKVGPKGIASLLRKAGIWTYDDFRNNTAVVNGVFREACQINYSHFVDATHARQRTQEGKE